MHSGICQSDSCVRWKRETFPPLPSHRLIGWEQHFEVQPRLLGLAQLQYMCRQHAMYLQKLQRLAEKNKTVGDSYFPNQRWETRKSWDIGMLHHIMIVEFLHLVVFYVIFSGSSEAFKHCQWSPKPFYICGEILKLCRLSCFSWKFNCIVFSFLLSYVKCVQCIAWVAVSCIDDVIAIENNCCDNMALEWYSAAVLLQTYCDAKL